MENWIETSKQLPPEGVVVETKIVHPNGECNIQDLKYVKPLWYVVSGDMYVYYTPTHWRKKT